MKHPHAEKMMEYAQDAMTTETPWEMWEFKSPENNGWLPLFLHPQWVLRNEYRRAPTVEFKEIHESNYIIKSTESGCGY